MSRRFLSFYKKQSSPKRTSGPQDPNVPEEAQPPPPAKEEVLDPWDFHSKHKFKSLKDTQPNEPGDEINTPVAYPARPDTFLDTLWEALTPPPPHAENTFRILSTALHQQTHALNKAVRARENWELASPETLKVLKTSRPIPLKTHNGEKRFYLCPPEGLQTEQLDQLNPWILAGTLIGTLRHDQPVATTLRMDERLGHLVFGSLGLGLVKMFRAAPPEQPVPENTPPDIAKHTSDAEDWPDYRNRAFKKVYDYQLALNHSSPLKVQEALLEVLQEPEAIWELNQRAGSVRMDFQKTLQDLYNQTDREVIRHLAEQHRVAPEDIRFSASTDPFKTFQRGVGRFITFQIRAKPGEKYFTPSANQQVALFNLQEASPEDNAWVDLPADRVRELYEQVFYRVAQADTLQPHHSPESFAMAMGQVFGDRLPAETFGKLHP